MAPLERNKVRKEDSWKVSGISKKFPTYRNSSFISTDSWLKGKRRDDGAESLWRIHDTLYDFTDFVDRHPGGSMWLAETKGTDITESFESHHISLGPERMLEKYKVRKAKNPRNYTLTLHEDGFYKTLKARVRGVYKDLDYSPAKRSDFYHSCLLAVTVLNAILSVLTGKWIFQLISGVALGQLTIVSHNYFHRRDNWRMYAFNMSLMNFSAWRVSHALSHHMYPNSMHDLEMSLFEPFLCWVPNPYVAPKLRRVITAIIQPVFYAIIFPVQMINRIVASLKDDNIMHWHDAIGFLMPLVMYAAGSESLLTVLGQWMTIVCTASFTFGLTTVAYNVHHDPENYHDGDATRRDRDWGLFQIDTVIERPIVKKSQFLVLATFGDHILHHMFPTLDHGVLPQLYPLFEKTLKEFNANTTECTQFDTFVGHTKQLLRTEPNQVPPESNKKRSR